jgi:GNAT superfamily N-acetyltransferase
MPDLRLIPSPDLPRDLKCQILSYIRIEWPWIFRDGNRFWDYTDKSTHPVNVVITERGLLISHAEVNWRMLEHAGQTYKVCGVSAVFTYPAFRKEGYGLQVLRAATAFIQASDADLALLFCLPQLVSFYTKAGWEAPASAKIIYGDPLYPHIEKGVTCALFVSERGRAARPAFITQPVYIGLGSW